MNSIQTARVLQTPKRRMPGPYPRASYLLLGLFVLALLAFWPEYIVKLPHTSLDQNLHGAAMTLWFALLISQPMLIRRGHRDLHRLLGRASYVLLPLAALSILLLSHYQLASLPDATFERFGQRVGALPLTFDGMFVTSYVLAIRHRRRTALHARFMIATSFPLIGPIFVRLFQHYAPGVPGPAAFLLSAVVFTNLVPAWLAWRDRHATGPARHAFRIVLAQQAAWLALFFLLAAVPLAPFAQALGWYRGLAIP